MQHLAKEEYSLDFDGSVGKGNGERYIDPKKKAGMFVYLCILLVIMLLLFDLAALCQGGA